ncbi:MAG: hypothetical protein E7571_06265 [Ruminococcaceae bacterium]|nr:hypothetical protein [Oscillospiraceae bacterium]
MNNKKIIRILSVVAVVCLALTANIPSGVMTAAAAPSLEEQREELKRQLAAADKKLEELGQESKDTEEYIDALGDKINYLTKQYNLAKDEADEIEKKVASLENDITSNEREIVSMGDEIETLEKNIGTLNAEFSGTYSEFCDRMRAIYISGQYGSSLTFLLTSGSLSSLLTRYEMVSAVSKRDGELLDRVQQQTSEIMQAKELLANRSETLRQTQAKLLSNKTQLKSERVTLLKKQEDMAAQQSVIEAQQQAQNEHLLDLHNKTKEYGEFRDLTQAELDEIDADIAEADRKYNTETTTKKPTATTTQKPAEDGSKTETTTQKPTTTTSAPSGYISLTYPCPRYTTITCGFGAYEGHTGCDFSTHGNENQKIVAAESGTVILVKLLERSYGHYIVIRHDKTTSGGKSVYTLYAHNNDIIVYEGQHVGKGQQIAYSGSTGNSTGPHCHFEVRVGGSSQSYAQNPANYLP